MACRQNGLCFRELLFLEGLTHIFVHAQLGRITAVFVCRARSDHNDWQILRARILTQALGQFEAVHTRHLHIQQHHVRNNIDKLFQCVDAILGGDDL